MPRRKPLTCSTSSFVATRPGSSSPRRSSAPPAVACACEFWSTTVTRLRAIRKSWHSGRKPNIEVRIFNPFDYRGHNAFLRHVDFVIHKGRLDYRMHNKLMVIDNSVALVGGRNIGAQYFQVEPDSQFADDDAFAAGVIAAKLSKTFDSYWNSEFAVPSTSLPLPKERSAEPKVSFADGGTDYRARIASGKPLQDLIADDAALHWAKPRSCVTVRTRKTSNKGRNADI